MDWIGPGWLAKDALCNFLNVWLAGWLVWFSGAALEVGGWWGGYGRWWRRVLFNICIALGYSISVTVTVTVTVTVMVMVLPVRLWLGVWSLLEYKVDG